MDLHALEALLNRHCSPTRRSPSDVKMEIPGGTILFLSRLPISETPSTAAQPSPVINKSSRHGSVSSRDGNSEVSSQSSFNGSVAYRERKYYGSTDIDRHVDNTTQYAGPMKQVNKTKSAPQGTPRNGYESIHQPIHSGQLKTCRRGTQTDTVDPNQNMDSWPIENMAAIISKLYSEIRSLENEMNAKHRRTPSSTISDLSPHRDLATSTPDILKIQQYKNHYEDSREKCTKSIPYTNDARANSNAIEMDASDCGRKDEDSKANEQIADEISNPEVVPIGEGYAFVPARLLKQIDWSSYKIATRKLLTAVFSRRVLATHSLTGESSRVSPGIPAKKQLEPRLVEDIVLTVVERCGVPMNFVRTIIRLKCGDESKRYNDLKKKNKI